MINAIYLLASAILGLLIAKLLYIGYAFSQLFLVNDYIVGGLIKYQLVGFIFGLALGRYWQLNYKYWASMKFIIGSQTAVKNKK